MIRRLLVCAVGLGLSVADARAQTAPTVPLGQQRTVRGLVQRPGADGAPAPVARQLVVLHRVGQDTAGPLDSTYTIRRRRLPISVPDDGFARRCLLRVGELRWHRLLHRAAPESRPSASPDGDIIVFDTTSRGVALSVQGRHVVISAPGRRRHARRRGGVRHRQRAAQDPDCAATRVTPLWTAQLPARCRLAGGQRRGCRGRRRALSSATRSGCSRR